MIPQTDNYSDMITDDFEYATPTFRTYELDPYSYRVRSTKIDGIDAIAQAIYLILSIERYDYVIYDEFGVEIKNLFGKQDAYVLPELERVVKDAILRVDGVEQVSDFKISKGKNKRIITGVAHTIYGDIDIEREVDL